MTLLETNVICVKWVIKDFQIVRVCRLRKTVDVYFYKNVFFFSESSAMRIAACGCSIIGSSSLACDFSGKCPCKVGYTGEKCDQCQSGYSKDRSGACIGIYSYL